MGPGRVSPGTHICLCVPRPGVAPTPCDTGTRALADGEGSPQTVSTSCRDGASGGKSLQTDGWMGGGRERDEEEPQEKTEEGVATLDSPGNTRFRSDLLGHVPTQTPVTLTLGGRMSPWENPGATSF